MKTNDSYKGFEDSTSLEKIIPISKTF